MIQKIRRSVLKVAATGVLVVVSLAGSLAHAGALGSVGTAVSYSLDTSGRNYEADAPVSVRGGYRFKFADLYAEASVFSKKSDGTDMIAVASRNIEFLLWGRKSFSLTKSFALYGALGFGGHQETIATVYGDDAYRDEGQVEAVGAMASGLQWKISRVIEASIEARLSAAESYSPSPRFGLGAFIGFVL
jgi:hypothetical protein